MKTSTLSPRRPAAPLEGVGDDGTKAVAWYRTRIDKDLMKSLHERSDLKGAMQTLGYLGWLAATGALAVYSWYRLPWFVTVACVFFHGLGWNFIITGVHELSHGTVFKTKRLNKFFVRVLAFLGWVNFEVFQVSHARHHRYTLHPPDDLEVVLPLKVLVKNFLQQGFVHFGLPFSMVGVPDTFRIACGQLRGPWENALFPETSPGERRRPIRWARVMLAGHATILLTGALTGCWWLPLLITCAPFYGAALFFLCGNTQHIGLQDHVSDFRLCTRSFTTNPLLQFLYWHMNYHIEHHMFAAVPCYNLGRLHRAIKHDLPPTPHGLVKTWKQIAKIQAQQKTDAKFQYVPPLPARV